MIVFRLGLFQAEEERARELAEAIARNPGCCDSVWLCTMGYYPPIRFHEEYARNWLPSAEIFRRAGLTVDLQISNTLGHGDFDQLDPKREDVFSEGMRPTNGEDPYMVGPDGTKNIGCFCWRSDMLRDYLCATVKTYASVLQPNRLWFDDDLRAQNHAPNTYGCFCRRCVEEFNRRTGTAYTREDLVHEINYGSLDLRLRYVEFMREGLHDLTLALANACLEVSPHTAFGYEYSHSRCYIGRDDIHILSALYEASGKEVYTRPGGSYYNDKSPWGQFYKAFSISCANTTLPPYVTERLAELENLPGVVYGKSIGGILNEATVDLAFGCTGITLTDVQSCHEPMSYYERIFRRLSVARPYWERLRALSKNAYPGGVAVYLGDLPHSKPLSPDAPPFRWEKMLREDDVPLLRLGIPLSYDQHKPCAFLLHHDTAAALTDRDIEFLLTQPVITDGETVDSLIKRGYGSFFALTPMKIDNLTDEIFTHCPENGTKAGLFYTENCYAASPMQRYVFGDLDERTKILGEARRNIHLSDGALLGACTVITDVVHPSAEAKWLIFGYSIWSDIVSSAKRQQIVGGINTIAPLPATLLSEEQAVVLPSVDENGQTLAVTVVAASQNGAEEILLNVWKPFGKTVSAMSTKGAFTDVTLLSASDGRMTVRLGSLAPYEAVTVFLDR